MNHQLEHEYTLAKLIEDEGLVRKKSIGNFDAVLEEILGAQPNVPMVVGIDGSVTAGKSFLSSHMERYLKRRNIDCVIVHGDWYMTSRERRMQEVRAAQKGSYDIRLFDRAVCNYEEIQNTQARIIEFFRSGQRACDFKITGAYSRETGLLDSTIHLDITNQTTVIFEGTGVLNASMKPGFDLSVRVDIDTYEETIKRLYARETEKEELQRIPEELVKQRYDLIDYRYDGYLRSRDSHYFDILLDTSDVSSTGLYLRV